MSPSAAIIKILMDQNQSKQYISQSESFLFYYIKSEQIETKIKILFVPICKLHREPSKQKAVILFYVLWSYF